VVGAWNLAHHTVGYPAYWYEWPDAVKALGADTVAIGTWNAKTATLDIRIHSPGT
jgi:hypothetical protein